MSKLLVIGSQALNFHFPAERPISVDYDIMGTYDDVMQFIRNHGDHVASIMPIDGGKKIVAKLDQSSPYSYSVIEAEIAWRGSTAEWLMDILIDGEKCDSVEGNGGVVYYIAPKSALYALKMSHRFLKNSPHFVKTRNDIMLMRKNGAPWDGTIPLYLQEWFVAREKETYHYQHPNLNVSKGEFFKVDEGVVYTYDHDSLHEAVKLTGVPAYTRFLDGEVKVSKEKWDDLFESYKLHAVLEESYVLALERSIIPFPKMRANPFLPFEMAVQKVCTSITSGWFRAYAWENYDIVMSSYSPSYVAKFDMARELGALKPFDMAKKPTYST